ncbi:MAG: thioesterase family protein [Steroidobacteraceae bacterium]
MTAVWDLPAPFIHLVTAADPDIDAYGHVNNSVYLRWLDQAAWAHSSALGLTPAHCVMTRRGMVVWRSQLHYLAPAFARETLEVGTWLVYSDARLRVDRRFQIRRPADDGTLLRGLLHYVCADLDSGRPRRMPAEFIHRYRPLPELAVALAEEHHRCFAPGVEPREIRPRPGLRPKASAHGDADVPR